MITEAIKLSFKEAKTPSELKKAYSILKELREGLTWDDFISIHRQARKENGYTLISAELEGKCVGVMGYRILHDYVHHRHFYIDDLVVTQSMRSKGLGEQFLAYAETLGKKLKCKLLRLSTGTANKGGMRFYERCGWELKSVTYKRKI